MAFEFDAPYPYDDPRLVYDERCFYYDTGYDEVCLAYVETSTEETKRRVGGSSGGAVPTAAPAMNVRHSIREIVREPSPDLLEIDIFSKILQINKEQYITNPLGNTLTWKGVLDTTTKVKVKNFTIKEHKKIQQTQSLKVNLESVFIKNNQNNENVEMTVSAKILTNETKLKVIIKLLTENLLNIKKDQ
jgi:hypothetical protein